MVKRRGSETIRDMSISLGVLTVGVLIFTAGLPKHHHDPVRPVEYASDLRLLAQQTKAPVLSPTVLPSGFQVTSVVTDVDPTRAQLTVVIGKKRFAQLSESARPDAAFYRRAFVGGVRSGVRQVGGAAYDVRRDAGGHTALVRNTPALTVVVSDGGGRNGATPDELARLAGALRPVG